MTCTSRDLGIAIASVLATLLYVRLDVGGMPRTVLGRPKARGERAFLLIVTLHFPEPSRSAALLEAWRAAADYCIEREPFLYAYEVAQSDKDPRNYTILERYRSKHDYLGAHRKSSAFAAFRPQMRAMQKEGAVLVGGSSYVETGIGFT